MDFTREPAGFSLGLLSAEAHDYLASSSALVGTPVNRLSAMNRRAVELFDAHGTDLYSQPVELDVCAQHNNGGFTADILINFLHRKNYKSHYLLRCHKQHVPLSILSHLR